MKTQTLDYSSDGQNYRGYLAYDETKTGKRPGVLVIHEAWGLNGHAKERADRLAALGYVAFAADMVGDGKIITKNEEALQWAGSQRSDVPKLRRQIRAAFDALAAQPTVDAARIAGIGYCIGGTTVLELARSGAPVACVVSFHGGLETKVPAEPQKVRAKILVCTGSEDHLIPMSQVEGFVKEMTAAGADFEVAVYGGAKHSFTNPKAGERGLDVLAYQKNADQRSWSAMQSMFNEAFG